MNWQTWTHIDTWQQSTRFLFLRQWMRNQEHGITWEIVRNMGSQTPPPPPKPQPQRQVPSDPHAHKSLGSTELALDKVFSEACTPQVPTSLSLSACGLFYLFTLPAWPV